MKMGLRFLLAMAGVVSMRNTVTIPSLSSLPDLNLSGLFSGLIIQAEVSALFRLGGGGCKWAFHLCNQSARSCESERDRSNEERASLSPSGEIGQMEKREKP